MLSLFGAHSGIVLHRPGCPTGLPFPGHPVVQCSEPAGIQAVEAVHAAAVVNLMIVNIYAGRLAFMLAGAAVPAFVRIDDRPEEGESREETQYSSHRAKGIARMPTTRRVTPAMMAVGRTGRTRDVAMRPNAL